MSKQLLVGAGVGSGIAQGPAFVLRTADSTADGPTGLDSGGIEAIKSAINSLATQLEVQSKDSESGDILMALAAMLRDPVLLDSIKEFLATGSGSERAVRGAFNSFARKLERLGGYFAERSADLQDLSNKVIDRLGGQTGDVDFPDEPFVLVTTELSPILAASLKQTPVLAVITEKGSATSHSAIITRGANLPTVMGVVGASEIVDGQELLVDATSGQVFVEPNHEEIQQYAEAAYPSTTVMSALPDPADLPVAIMANLGSSFEIPTAIRAGAQGVGLFRTELLFLGHKRPPSKDEQIFEYTKLLAGFQGSRVIVRVLDIDVDKPLEFLYKTPGGPYPNRGLRVLLQNRSVLKTQLEALAAAAEYYPTTELWVMAPMVVSVSETKEFVKLARSVGLKTVGIMIEVPEITKRFTLNRALKYVDFVSIGTNDLTQYVLRRSRYSSNMALSETRNNKVLLIIDNVIRACKARGIHVGICGEAAADPASAKIFIRMGVDSLSASPALIPALASALV
ncbi:MAG: Phosphoenolpyruvate-protein phosphotransferase system, component [Actinomycetota bacterium]